VDQEIPVTHPQSITPGAEQWDAFVEKAGGHLLQASAWGALKSAFGWQAERVALTGPSGEITCGAQVLYRPLPLGLGSIAYVPRGPVGDWDEKLLAALDDRARARHAVLLKLEPDEKDSPQAAGRLRELGLRPSPHVVQPRRTLLVDLRPDEDGILAAMVQKTRYNVRLAARKGITVREGTADDLESYNRLTAATGKRDAFGVHSPDYYRMAYNLFSTGGHVALLMASYEGEDLAGLMVFAQGERATYLYGASSNEERNRMPTYGLQWEAMRWAKARGCTTYDLWGVPDADVDALETQFTQRSDGLWGVYRFKRGFGGRLARTVGPWDRVYRPLLYAAYKVIAARSGD
jgi:lipid II:glycine glycyltransferase (peptidoglycan interpeptide bridge formation enzyme)